MVKSLMVRDDVYERLSRLKKNGESFSDVITRLLDNHVEAVDSRQMLQVLQHAIAKLDNLESIVLGLSNMIEKKGILVSDASPPVTGVTPKKKRDDNLPSFLQDNPWVEILAERQ